MTPDEIGRLCIGLDALLAADANPWSLLPKAAKGDKNAPPMADLKNAGAKALEAYISARALEFASTFDPALAETEEVPYADLLLHVDPMRPYHVWAVYLSDKDIAERVRGVPPFIKKVLVGPGQAPPDCYHLVDLPPRKVRRSPKPRIDDVTGTEVSPYPQSTLRPEGHP